MKAHTEHDCEAQVSDQSQTGNCVPWWTRPAVELCPSLAQCWSSASVASQILTLLHPASPAALSTAAPNGIVAAAAALHVVGLRPECKLCFIVPD